MCIRILVIMVRRMKATITQIASVVTPLDNSGHVIAKNHHESFGYNHRRSNRLNRGIAK